MHIIVEEVVVVVVVSNHAQLKLNWAFTGRQEKPSAGCQRIFLASYMLNGRDFVPVK